MTHRPPPNFDQNFETRSLSAYVIDDGKGGKIHVNVSIFYTLPKPEHSRRFTG